MMKLQLGEMACRHVPGDLPDIVTWAEENVVLPTSVRSKHFRASIVPQLVKPMRAAVARTTRTNTLIKPVQCGGSTAGEVVLLYAMNHFSGFMQYNWSNDKRAKERWESRIEAIIKACQPVMRMIAARPDDDFTKLEVDLGNLFFRMQGAFVPDNLDSDSVNIQINEEVHSWEPGHLAKARNRQTAVWNRMAFDISNASMKNDQLHEAFKDGTQQRWAVKCPGCNQWHIMRTRWEDKHPELGGLRYDSEKAMRPYGYDYNIVRDTARYQMPCGYVVPNDTIERRKLSDAGDYTDPRPGSELAHLSWTFEAVSVDYIDWVQLIKEKHAALRARRLGDNSQWVRYLTERECIFYDNDEAPLVGVVTVSKDVKKSREGLPDPKLRFFALDYQRGNLEDGELPHWWLVIRDVAAVDGRLRSMLVYEGKIDTDERVIEILDEHKCLRWLGCADTGYNATHVYAFCMRHGINAVKGGSEDFYSHQGQARRIWSVEKPLHAMLNRAPVFPYLSTTAGMLPDPREPMFWLYSKMGIRERLHWMQANTEWIVPDDASEDYKKHCEAEERTSRLHPRTNQVIWEWVQKRSRNDLWICECYIAMQIEQSGMMFLPTEPTK